MERQLLLCKTRTLLPPNVNITRFFIVIRQGEKGQLSCVPRTWYIIITPTRDILLVLLHLHLVFYYLSTLWKFSFSGFCSDCWIRTLRLNAYGLTPAEKKKFCCQKYYYKMKKMQVFRFSVCDRIILILLISNTFYFRKRLCLL